MNSDTSGMSGMGSMGGDSSSTVLTPVYASDFDLNNMTQAMDFLSQMLDDTILQVDGNNYAQYFWYGIVTLIGLASILNLLWRGTLVLRYFLQVSDTCPKANGL